MNTLRICFLIKLIWVVIANVFFFQMGGQMVGQMPQRPMAPGMGMGMQMGPGMSMGMGYQQPIGIQQQQPQFPRQQAPQQQNDPFGAL